ncbi:NAD(P)-dependent oxidoreductase [Microbacterium caowuchunii]|uniref:NAD(P)-dependent oxidoreductase n=1 Tax=Microbacterium caowuchunii TaxID=2614638 RepID=UPI0012477D92|nr:NAD(P)-dependent oxidoreductase [Microbacterium caowuchunii]QEV98790.1 NAD(P)-dependent oxidoreductase [Microbacterium caowuchunii]
MTHVGFIGIGRMGAAIAGRLAAAGVPLTVWNRSRSAAEHQLVDAGATRAASAADALAAPVSFSMLADDAAVDTVLSTENLGRSDAPRIHVNMASISAAMADILAARFADAGVRYVSAPVLGRPEVAAQGKLNVLLAGPAEALDVVDPYLAHCSVRRWRFGDTPRQANAVKIAVNFMILQSLESLGESIALVESQDVDATQFVELIGASLFGGAVHTGYGSIIAERRYSPPGFTVSLGRKDLGLAEQLAAEGRVDVPMAAVLRDRFETALADPELADLDWSAVAEVSRRSVGGA